VSAIGRKIDSRRITQAANKDEIQAFFDLFHSVKQELGVRDENCWNFDEHGTSMGANTNQKVMADAARVMRREIREWVSIIEVISGTGRSISPAIIFKAETQNLQSTWFPHNFLELPGSMAS
jgi:hypothetical protein